MGKLFEGVLLHLLRSSLEIRSLEAQYGFQDGRSIENAITRLYDITEEAEERYMITIFVDIQSAFESMWWPVLMTELKQRDCPHNLYLIIRNYLTRSRHDGRLLPHSGETGQKRMSTMVRPWTKILEPRNGRPTETAGRTSVHPAHSVCRRSGDPNPWKQQKGT